jgi:rRNA maturation endonuclease Nob1
MIGKHCGKPLWSITDNRFYFRKQCQVCKRIFKQKKRQKGK